MQGFEIRMVRRVAVSLAAAVVSGVSFVAPAATTTTFPLAGGDLASAEAWGGTLPGTDAHLVLSKAGTYTLSKAAEFASIRQAAAGETVFDFTEAPGPLTLNDRSDATGSNNSIFCFPYYQSTISTVMKGGTWVGSGKYNFNPCGLGNVNSWPSYSNDYVFMMTNGCVVTNVKSVSVANRIYNFRMTMADKSKIFASGELRVSENGGSNTVFTVCSGSELRAGSVIYTDAGSENPKRVVLFDVHGTGTKVVGGDSIYVGFRSSYNVVRVRDSAEMELTKSIAMNQGGTATNNTLEVLNGAAVTAAGIYMKYDSDNKVIVSNATLDISDTIDMQAADELGNRVEITDNASVSMKDLHCLNNCRVDVSGASLDVSNVFYLYGVPERKAFFSVRDGADVSVKGLSSYSNSVIEVSGADTVFTDSEGKSRIDGGLFNYGNNSIILDDGYTDRRAVEFRYMNSPSNLLKVTGGAVLDRSSVDHKSNVWMYLGYDSKSSDLWPFDNRVEISDGGTIKADRFFVCGSNNTVVVSNGTLIAGCQSTSPLWLGYANGTSTTSRYSNVKLVLAGTNPVVRVMNPADATGYGTLTMQNGSGLRYDIPKEGYPEGHVPFITKINQIVDTATFEVNCEEWAADGSIEGNKLVLLRSPNELTGRIVTKVNECAETMPPGVTLTVSGTDIVLRRPGRGYRLIVR